MDKLYIKYFKQHQALSGEIISSDFKVVVPVYLEEDDLFKMLESVQKATTFSGSSVELILVFNYSELASEQIIQRQVALLDRVEEHRTVFESTGFDLTILKDYSVAKKHAGVGHARKTGMDFAAFSYVTQEKYDGIIVSLDADCTVSDNYFSALNECYSKKCLSGCNVYFEHPLAGNFHSEVYDAIAEYELHLRYYIQALRYAAFPHAFHTVGSCFTVTAEAYIKAGGMPRKQAGEDFYFLQKVIPSDKFEEVNNTCVYPSSRPSDRVPFGTGPSISAMLESKEEYQTYNLQAFIDLKEFIAIKDELYQMTDEGIESFTHQLSGRIRSYLVNSDFFPALQAVKDNCSSLEVFQKRFYEVFNAFRVVKYLNYTHTHFLEKMNVFDAAINLYEMKYEQALDVFDTKELLLAYRQLEKS
ncbi:glycosyltransferase [Carboxylicivirga marina]|uniref:glycosyltransferase n=1 Tax=Carboxylicivirga marina TaxID=2800988 RepID=UPI0025960E48|nr:glycosyltransferase family A protein [uncultured Carboxylicivirga sp.]